MTDTAPTESPPTSLPELSGRMADDLALLDTELAEIDLLIAQAQTEAGRHETRRAAGADKIATAEKAAESAGTTVDPAVAADLQAQLVVLTKRAALMETQVEVLEGKRRALGRYRDGLATYLGGLETITDTPLIGATPKIAARAGDKAGAPPAVSRLLLDTQEDLRREIAKAMHDGPAQSLTNIVLQAQIVERLLDGDDRARLTEEVRLLMQMAQQTLEATKAFIFEVRPMVLDDLGLVPTLRRATRERAKRAGITVDFESMGTERRLPMDMESGLFRILDGAMAAYEASRAEVITLQLDWSERFGARVTGSRAVAAGAATGPALAATDVDLPPALAAMMEDRRADARDAIEAARKAAVVTIPPSTWREIQERAAALGMTVELAAEGAELRLAGPLPSANEEPAVDQAS